MHIAQIISAIIMCMIAIPILIIGGLPFKIFVAILGVAPIYEILDIRKKKKRIPFVIRIISYILVGLLVFFGSSTYMVNYELIYKIIAGIFLIYFIPVIIINDDKKYDATDAFYDYHMGITAENICEQWKLTREELDEFAAAKSVCPAFANHVRFLRKMTL